MRKTSNWSFHDVVRVGADDILSQNQAKNFQDAMTKAAAAVLWVIRDEFISQLPKSTSSKSLSFDHDKFSIAVLDDNDTVVVSYDGIVFEVHQKNGPIQPGFIGFVLINNDDERLSQYVDKLKLIKHKSRQLREQYRKSHSESRAEYLSFGSPKRKDYIN